MVPRRFRFTLISYNILSQTLLNNHSYLYTNCKLQDLEWPNRGLRIVSELLNNKADIICLQEVESEHLRTLYRPKLARNGYQCLYKKKTGYKMDGCAIFYKSNLFHLLNYKGIEFNRTDLTSILNRDNIGIIAVLKPKVQTLAENSKLVIANTHLIFNPRRADIRLAQLKYFLSEIEEISFESQNRDNRLRYHHPTILCGDLNSLPESDISKFVTKNQSLKSNNLSRDKSCGSETRYNLNNQQSNSESVPAGARSTNCNDAPASDIKDDILNNLNHSIKFRSVYPKQDRRGRPFVSTFSSCIVDYIFYTPKLRLESYRELLTADQLRDVGPIPNEEFPSDHLTLEATFSM